MKAVVEVQVEEELGAEEGEEEEKDDDDDDKYSKASSALAMRRSAIGDG